MGVLYFFSNDVIITNYRCLITKLLLITKYTHKDYCVFFNIDFIRFGLRFFFSE